MNVKVLPVEFIGVVWGSPDKEFGRKRQPSDNTEARVSQLKEEIPDADVLEPCIVNAEEEIGKLLARSRGVDVVVVTWAELFSVRWAAKALELLDIPVILKGRENYPTPVFADLYGYLTTDDRHVHLTVNTHALREIILAIALKKRLASMKALVIGDAFPSFSQVANPTSPDIVRQRLGVDIVVRTIDDLFAAFESVPESDAEQQAQKWLDGAASVSEEAKRDIVPCAKVYFAVKKMLEEEGASAFTINCRAWDEFTMEKFGRFYGPCMTLTTLRWEGIPAACEADIAALMSMCVLMFLSGLPAFMGNIGRVDPTDNWITIEHAAAAANMDGKSERLEGYSLLDYQRRGTGLASYCPVPEGQFVTISRFDKYLRRIALITGTTLATERGFKVVTGHIGDLLENCLVGDHHAVVYGDHSIGIKALARMLDLEVIQPRGCFR